MEIEAYVRRTGLLHQPDVPRPDRPVDAGGGRPKPYRAEILEFASSLKAPAYLAINPMGKVPAMRHGDTVVTECAAICAYLAHVFP